MKSMLLKHKFQFVRFCDVRHGPSRKTIHLNDDSHIMHVIRGKGAVTMDGTAYPLERGTVISAPAGVEFWFDAAPQMAMRNLHYRLWLESGEQLEERFVLPPVFQPAHFPQVEAWLSAIQALGDSRPQSHAEAACLAHRIIVQHWFNTEWRPRAAPPADERSDALCRLLRAPDLDHFSARNLARQVGLSVSQMNRVFRRRLKCSPQTFWNRQRLAAVRMALKDSGRSITEISNQFGFVDPAYFSRWFSKQAGCSAARYRRQLADAGAAI
ncbi:MAG: helix-turn-helix transcriptional regulator [Kiritimatiellae bacterium]|nr:helix-turn-helix transcriptional regulator [Kiritimatiellia bacterium]